MEAVNEFSKSSYSWEDLYKKASKGNIQTWRICVFELNGTGVIRVIHGKLGGKHQSSDETISTGKNIGKVNETTPYQQACAEAESRWIKQIERKGYVRSFEDLDEDTRPGAEPMLAHRFDKYSEKVIYPCAVQPKLDGHRCIAVFEDGKTELFSRQRKPITGLPHIQEAVTAMLIGKVPAMILDGELYNHDYKNNFEELTSHIRNESPKDGYTVVQYHLYDIVAGFPFQERAMALAHVMSDVADGTLVHVRTQLVDDQEDVINAFNAHRTAGYEGSILRNLDGIYEGRRSYDLQKVKTFLDEEFTIVGVEEGRGKMAGHAIFVCHTKDGKEFRAKMKGDMTKLTEYFQNAANYVGRIVTVQFQDYTKDGIPRFPVALRFREDV